jgi:hypothetical protein
VAELEESALDPSLTAEQRAEIGRMRKEALGADWRPHRTAGHGGALRGMRRAREIPVRLAPVRVCSSLRLQTDSLRRGRHPYCATSRSKQMRQAAYTKVRPTRSVGGAGEQCWRNGQAERPHGLRAADSRLRWASAAMKTR